MGTNDTTKSKRIDAGEDSRSSKLAARRRAQLQKPKQVKWSTNKPENSRESDEFLRFSGAVMVFFPWGYRYTATFQVEGELIPKGYDHYMEFSSVSREIADTVAASALWEQWQEEIRKKQRSRAPLSTSKGPQPFSRAGSLN